MMKKLTLYPLVLLVLCSQAAMAETIYKGRDSTGKIIYSDVPTTDSHPIQIAPIQTYEAPPIVNLEEERKKIEKAQALNYQIAISSPKNEQVFTHDINTIDVKVSVEPKLDQDDRIRLILNNEPYGPLSETPVIQLERLSRGEYQIKAQIVSSNGQGSPKAESSTVTFYQQRAIANRPGGPNFGPQGPVGPR